MIKRKDTTLKLVLFISRTSPASPRRLHLLPLSLPTLNRGDDHEQQLRPSRPSRLVLPPPGRNCARGDLTVPKIDALEQSPSASRASTARSSHGPLGPDRARAPPSSSCTSPPSSSCTSSPPAPPASPPSLAPPLRCPSTPSWLAVVCRRATLDRDEAASARRSPATVRPHCPRLRRAGRRHRCRRRRQSWSGLGRVFLWNWNPRSQGRRKRE
jgi:hypothetical protein